MAAGSCGPWSLEWARRHKVSADDDAMLLKSNSNIKVSKRTKIMRKKGRSSFRHCAKNLKRIARLSEGDRKEVLRALRKTRRRQKVVSETHLDKVILNDSSYVIGSQSSINNDWSNWLVLHGSSKAMSDDVKGLGKRLGVNFQGDYSNRFEVLSGVGRKNREGDGGGK